MLYTCKRNVALSLLFVSFSALQAMSNHQIAVAKLSEKAVFVPHHLGKLAVVHYDKSFYIEQEGGYKKVQDCFVDKELRGVSQENLAKFLVHGYIFVNRMSDGEYSLKLLNRLPGGGIFGANIGFYVGKTAVYVVGHGGIWAVSLLAGPGQPVAQATLEAYLAGPIEAASNVVGLGAGILGAAATGPA